MTLKIQVTTCRWLVVEENLILEETSVLGFNMYKLEWFCLILPEFSIRKYNNEILEKKMWIVENMLK